MTQSTCKIYGEIIRNIKSFQKRIEIVLKTRCTFKSRQISCAKLFQLECRFLFTNVFIHTRFGNDSTQLKLFETHHSVV